MTFSRTKYKKKIVRWERYADHYDSRLYWVPWHPSQPNSTKRSIRKSIQELRWSSSD